MTCKKESPYWFKIDPAKFLSDSLISAMNAVEFGATWRLLLHQWNDGYITDNLAILARLCRLTLPEMEAAWPMVSEFFPEIEPGKRANRFMYSERAVLVAEFERKKAAGREAIAKRWPKKDAAKSNENRSAIGDLTKPDTNPIQELETELDKEQVQKPSRAKAARATKSAVADERHTAFKGAIKTYWDSKNPGVEMPWGPMEGKQLGMWLREAPHITLDQFTGFLRARFKSDVNHSERPSQWIRWVTCYASGPIDRFGKPLQENAHGTPKPSVTSQRVAANDDALGAALARRGINPACLTRQANAPALPEPRLDGQPGGVPVGFRATGPEILPPQSHGGAGGAPHQAGSELLSATG